MTLTSSVKKRLYHKNRVFVLIIITLFYIHYLFFISNVFFSFFLLLTRQNIFLHLFLIEI